MKYNHTCHCCWHVKVAYTHKLNKWLIDALRKIVDHYEIYGTRANVDKDLDLTYNQQSNFQKLKYFWLVNRNSDWRIPTSEWIRFIYWDCMSYDLVATIWWSVISYSHEARETHKTSPKMVFVYDIDETQYKKREDYAQERVWNSDIVQNSLLYV